MPRSPRKIIGPSIIAGRISRRGKFTGTDGITAAIVWGQAYEAINGSILTPVHAVIGNGEYFGLADEQRQVTLTRRKTVDR